ncbi:MAG: hypothetical protein KC431_08230 [Myxococcales bacterium]|nr:hypothetical protein [Myxococcales bacterium]
MTTRTLILPLTLILPFSLSLLACNQKPAGDAGKKADADKKADTDKKADEVKPETDDTGGDKPDADKPDAGALAFRNAVNTPPEGWSGPVFQLSADYPQEQPTCASPWLERPVDFTAASPSWDENWQAYVQDIVDYVKEGQDPNLGNERGWQAAVGGETRWFHVPWMAYDGHAGREFVHGLTNELSTAESTFVGGRGSGLHGLTEAEPKDEDPLYETWSVGFYNPCGAWSIGQQWPKSGAPATSEEGGRMLAKGMPFPAGTVVVKVLNTTASGEDVPYLKNSTTWQANGHKQLSPTSYDKCAREVREVHLVQMDLAVVDPRSPTRWVYSTLVYDGEMEGETVWDRMRPLGVQWGNDPGTFPAVPEGESKPLTQSINAPIQIHEHYGCQKRLAGNVDQANSSCLSCHMGAYAPAPGVTVQQGTNVPAIFSFDGMCTTYNDANKNYFSNYAYPDPFPGSTGEIAKAMPLDTSLQLQVAFAQYANFTNPPADPECPPAGSGS